MTSRIQRRSVLPRRPDGRYAECYVRPSCDPAKSERKTSTLRFGFHVHTDHSVDGFNTYERIYQQARLRGIDVLAVTDHDVMSGAFGFREWLERRGHEDVEAILGEEVTCSDGTHIIGLFLETEVKAREPVDVVGEIKGAGGLVYFPHPARKDGAFNSKHADVILSMGDFYECFNAKIANHFNVRAMEESSDYPHLRPLGGSDAHYNLDIGKCVCSLEHHGSLRQTLAAYQRHGRILIRGVVKTTDEGYLAPYYRMKRRFDPPRTLKKIGKIIVPALVNMKDRNKPLALSDILDTRANKAACA